MPETTKGAKIDRLIFDACYEIAGEITGCHPTRMGESEEFDIAFDEIQTAIYEAIQTKQVKA